VNADGLRELFEPFAAVNVKRVFGGHGIYAEGICFAIEARGEVYLKVDGETEAQFSRAGSSPFVYPMRGRAVTMAYWRLPAAAYDDAEALRYWAALGLEAARRAAAAKANKPAGRPRRAQMQ
jgi:DNA transformation protein and related proteins